MLVIEKNVPRTGSRSKNEVAKALMGTMVVGDSIKLPIKSVSTIYGWQKEHSHRYTCKPIENGYQCWRTE